MRDEANGKRFIPHRSSLVALLALFLACSRPEPPARAVHRIISLAPNVTEIVFAAGCGSKVVGTDSFSDTPQAVAKLPKLGGTEPDVEKIIALRPDLVIASASAAHRNLRRALSSVHIPLLVVKTDRLSEVPTAMSTVGHAGGCDAGPAIAAFNRRLEDNRHWRKTPPRVLFAVWTDPLYVAGRETFIDDLYRLTGAQNAADVQAWPQYSLESLMAHPPDLLLYPNRSVTREAAAALLGRAHLPIEAVGVDENVFTRPGPRMTEAAAALNGILDRWQSRVRGR